MKKLFSVFVAVAMVMGLGMTAQAADSVGVTLTSPTITKAPDACEKAGAVTFDFSPGAVLEQGDWWYMDLPNGATLCKPLDYLITGPWGAPATSYMSVDSLDPTLVTFGAGANPIGAGGNLTFNTAEGPITVQQTGAAGGVVTVVGNVALRVVGASGSRRVQIYVASDVAGVGSLTIPLDTTMKIKILDGQPHNTNANTPDDTHIIVDLDKAAFASAADIATGTITAGGRYRAYGEHPTGATGVDDHEIIDPNGAFVVPHVENTLCINAEDHAQDNLFVSFASKNDFLTFTGDSQIAHAGGGVSFTLEACTGKDASLDEIEIAAQDACTFDYENSNGYCPTHDDGIIYMQAADTFGQIDERYDLTIEILTSGVFFGGDPALRGFLPTQDACEDAGTLVGASWFICAGNDCTDNLPSDASYPSDASCTVDSDSMIDKIFTKGGDITAINNYGQISFNFNNFHYDTSMITAGTEVELEVTLDKYPCGTIDHQTIVIGTFVTECTTTATGTSSLFFPFIPGSKFAGWWGGYVVSNGSATAGTAELVATDTEGNKASYETDAIAGYGQFNASFLEVADWTQDSNNTANFDGSENYTVFVSCEFNRGSGMAMLGNSTEGVGYTADTTGW